MSQYPSPYNPPPYPTNPGYFAPYGIDPNRPAKRAGLLMIILGALALLLSLCMLGVRQVLLTQTLPPELAAQMQQMASTGVSPAVAFAILAGIFFVLAMFELVFGILTRTARKIPLILSLVGTAIILLIMAFMVIAGLVNGPSMGPEQLIAGIFFWALPLAMLSLQLVWLISALRTAPQSTSAMQQYAAQYWQYQQQMQASAGYGQQVAPNHPPSVNVREK